MQILCEDSMPYALEYFSDMGDCSLFSHRTVNAGQVADADILLVRSTTKVNAELLHLNSKLKFVATATAGTNHMDKQYLQGRNIAWNSAAGCNAVAVAEYVLSAIFTLAERQEWQLEGKTVGIVGAGHVGSALANKLDALSVDYKLCDPPLQDKGDPRAFVSLEDIMQCDIISLHVPLVTDGPHPTLHMFDKQRLTRLTEQQLLINACRGEVVDNQAALALYQAGHPLNMVLDVWENEPDILQPLVPFTALATAHIAGHTIEGKANGTHILYQQVCQLLGEPVQKQLSDFLPVQQQAPFVLPSSASDLASVGKIIRSVYDIASDDQHFRQHIAQPGQFTYIRKHYPIRREFAAFAVKAGNSQLSKALYGLGFNESSNNQ